MMLPRRTCNRVHGLRTDGSAESYYQALQIQPDLTNPGAQLPRRHASVPAGYIFKLVRFSAAPSLSNMNG